MQEVVIEARLTPLPTACQALSAPTADSGDCPPSTAADRLRSASRREQLTGLAQDVEADGLAMGHALLVGGAGVHAREIRASTLSRVSCFQLVRVRRTPGAVALVRANGAVRGPASASGITSAAPEQVVWPLGWSRWAGAWRSGVQAGYRG